MDKKPLERQKKVPTYKTISDKDKIIVYLPKHIKEVVRATAVEKGYTLSNYIVQIINRDLDYQKKKMYSRNYKNNY